jgi:hypothetical protein
MIPIFTESLGTSFGAVACPLVMSNPESIVPEHNEIPPAIFRKSRLIFSEIPPLFLTLGDVKLSTFGMVFLAGLIPNGMGVVNKKAHEHIYIY